MVTTSMPAPRRSILGRISGLLEGRKRPGAAVPFSSLLRRASTFVQQNALTLFGLGAIDAGCYHAGPIIGWIAIGVSAFVADWKLQG